MKNSKKKKKKKDTLCVGKISRILRTFARFVNHKFKIFVYSVCEIQIQGAYNDK